MSETVKSSSSEAARDEAGKAEAGDVKAKLREIARELDYGVPVLTREWRKRRAGELEAIAGLWVK